MAGIASTLSDHGQEQLLTPPPPPEKQEEFLAKLKALDYPKLKSTFETSLSQSGESRNLAPFTDVTELSSLPAEVAAGYRADGLANIAQGKTCALLLAGGQGTRLGSSSPKGCYNIGMPSNKPLFQYYCERITAVKRLAAAHAGVDEATVRLPFVIMCSHATSAETIAFFDKHDNFGLPKDQVIFFNQGTMPCFTLEGKLMLAAPGELAEAPDGNGGMYVALRESGVLTRLQKEGVTGIFQFGVDNCLCHVAEPTFLGFCQAQGADCAVKTVAKLNAHESVGVLALVNGKPEVVEYSELSKSMAEATDTSGQLLYSASHICVNWFSVAFVAGFMDEVAAGGMPWHVAKKKIPTVAPDGSAVKPDVPNGIKLELFIFDTFPRARRLVALQVPREEEFAPVKNAPGSSSDSPDTARALYSQLSRRRLLAAGATVSGDESALVEVSPLVSYQGEGLEAYADKALQAPVHLEK